MTSRFRPALPFALFLMLAAPLAAKESLGVFSGWAAFRDAQIPRCYAIAKPEPTGAETMRARQYEPYASIGSWPNRQIRGQVHFRLSREIRPNARVSLRVGGRSFVLVGGGGDAWAADPAMDAAIVAALRSAESMSVSSTTISGRRFTDRYVLAGAASAIDAATLGCAPAALSRKR
ncbi:hypothetical protein G6N82_14390 [Altererythrobacter sp. BO-6]|uniref:hypothetical protein n=1 Tax=Altererythrobacter sp. BO-6 TaxID=2604537 RepID=UPI0013E1A253|nr:hypothetical protein [Altererythrobacter sp. BO-6]QIG55178.1 hypothetical protein G6N82_14390 [Altererythrobacter sp. BO-6]